MARQANEDKILILATETCAYPGADSVGQAHSSYPANTYILRVRVAGVVSGTVLPGLFCQRDQRHYHHVLR